MTPDQLKRLALQQGATLELGGKVFNAGRHKLAAVPQQKPAPAPIAPVAPAPAAPDPIASIAPLIEAQTRAAAAQGESMAQVLAALLAELRKPRDGHAPRPLPVAFDVKRDGNGLLTRIVPVYRAGTLN